MEQKDVSTQLRTPSNPIMHALPRLSSLHISIHPNFAPDGSASTISFRLTISCTSLDVHSPLCVLPTEMGNGTTQCYSASQIQASDDRDVLRIETRDEEKIRFYLADRATAGDVVFLFTATPVKVGPATPIGGRYELRRDQGGLQFMGMSVVPIPWGGGLDTNVKYRIRIDWDLRDAPRGVRGVSSFGEGSVERLGRVFEVWKMVFVVGNVRSWPPSDVDSERGFGFYWFGDVPRSIAALPSTCEEIFGKLAAFFGDALSKANPYRVFVRRVTPARGFGGTGGIRSFVLEYDEDIGLVRQDEIFYLLAHEMVHNWPLMQSGKGSDMDLTAWYNEGVADYYASVLPYRLGLVSEEKYFERINAKLTEYYTNPLRLASNRDVQDKAWTSPDLQTLSYTRGMMYLLKLDAEIRDATHNSQTIDTVVLALLDKLRNEEKHGIPEWKHLVSSILGEKALHGFDAMNRGDLIRLPAHAFGPEYVLLPTEQRELDFGFDASSFFKRVVVGLKDGSEAAEAGIREGDDIVWYSFVWQCQTDYERKMMLDVKRGESVKSVEYWPRGERLVESWRVCRRGVDGVEMGDEGLEEWVWIDKVDAFDTTFKC